MESRGVDVIAGDATAGGAADFDGAIERPIGVWRVVDGNEDFPVWHDSALGRDGVEKQFRIARLLCYHQSRRCAKTPAHQHPSILVRSTFVSPRRAYSRRARESLFGGACAVRARSRSSRHGALLAAPDMNRGETHVKGRHPRTAVLACERARWNVAVAGEPGRECVRGHDLGELVGVAGPRATNGGKVIVLAAEAQIGNHDREVKLVARCDGAVHDRRRTRDDGGDSGAIVPSPGLDSKPLAQERARDLRLRRDASVAATRNEASKDGWVSALDALAPRTYRGGKIVPGRVADRAELESNERDVLDDTALDQRQSPSAQLRLRGRADLGEMRAQPPAECAGVVRRLEDECRRALHHSLRDGARHATRDVEQSHNGIVRRIPHLSERARGGEVAFGVAAVDVQRRGTSPRHSRHRSLTSHRRPPRKGFRRGKHGVPALGAMSGEAVDVVGDSLNSPTQGTICCPSSSQTVSASTGQLSQAFKRHARSTDSGARKTATSSSSRTKASGAAVTQSPKPTQSVRSMRTRSPWTVRSLLSSLTSPRGRALRGLDP